MSPAAEVDETCLRCGAVLDSEEGIQTGICPGCWDGEFDGPLEPEEAAAPAAEPPPLVTLPRTILPRELPEEAAAFLLQRVSQWAAGLDEPNPAERLAYAVLQKAGYFSPAATGCKKS